MLLLSTVSLSLSKKRKEYIFNSLALLKNLFHIILKLLKLAFLFGFVWWLVRTSITEPLSKLKQSSMYRSRYEWLSLGEYIISVYWKYVISDSFLLPALDCNTEKYPSIADHCFVLWFPRSLEAELSQLFFHTVAKPYLTSWHIS